MSKKEVITMLKTFIKTGNIKYPLEGLCHNIFVCQKARPKKTYVTVFQLDDMFRSWDKFSGNCIYPVESPWWSIISARNYFRGNLYEGRQLKMRKLLAQHIINELDLEL